METNNSKRKIIIILVIMIAAAALLSFFGISKAMTPQRYAKACELGRKYLDEMDYDNALIAFDKAVSIEPRNWDAYEGKMKAYVGKSDDESVIKTFETAQNNVAPADITQSGKDIAVTSYEAVSKTKIAAGDYAGAIDALRKAEALGSDESSNIDAAVTEGALNASSDGNLEDALKWLEANGAKDTERYSALSGIADELKSLAGVAASDDEEGTGIVEAMRNGGFLQKIQEVGVGDKPLKIIDGNGMMSAFYPINGDVFYYYGGQENGERRGQGTWVPITQREGYSYMMTGSWANDKPNGAFKSISVRSLSLDHIADGNYIVVWNGNVIDGLWDGTINITEQNDVEDYFFENTCTAIAHNGVFEVLRESADGIVIAGTGQTWFDVYQNEANGIAGFDKN